MHASFGVSLQHGVFFFLQSKSKKHFCRIHGASTASSFVSYTICLLLLRYPRDQRACCLVRLWSMGHASTFYSIHERTFLLPPTIASQQWWNDCRLLCGRCEHRIDLAGCGPANAMMSFDTKRRGTRFWPWTTSTSRDGHNQPWLGRDQEQYFSMSMLRT